MTCQLCLNNFTGVCKDERAYRFLLKGLEELVKRLLLSGASSGCEDRRAVIALLGASRLPSLRDLASMEGRSMTRKEDWGGFSDSSRTLPDDLRRANPLGILMGILMGLEEIIAPRLDFLPVGGLLCKKNQPARTWAAPLVSYNRSRPRRGFVLID